MSEKKSLITKFADRYDVDAKKVMSTLKQTAFKQNSDTQVSDAQMMALLIVADQHKLNPFTREIYAFPDKQNGIVPVVGVDGWSRIMNEHPQFDGLEFKESETKVKMDEDAKECPEWMEIIIHRKDRNHPIVVREYLDEVYRPAFTRKGTNYKIIGPWQTHTKRFLRHKTLIQGARLGFSFAGMYDEDEAQRIEETNVIDIDENDFSDITENKPIDANQIIKSINEVEDALTLEAIRAQSDLSNPEILDALTKAENKLKPQPEAHTTKSEQKLQIEI